MKKILFFLLLQLIAHEIFSQGFSNIWEMGYSSSGTPDFYINFNTPVPTTDTLIRAMNISETSAAICDSSGQLLFYTNGIYIANRNNNTMLNGTGINPGPFTSSYATYGLPIFQAALILPFPDSANKYILIHETGDITTIYPQVLYYSIIDMTLDGGLGGVTIKNDTIINSQIELGEITACKHANGRDWWVLAHKHLTDQFYKLLITPSGIASIDSQTVGGIISDYGGEAIFSPDGNWYATFDNLSKLRLYNFDRCTGTLSNFQYFNIVPDSILAGGLSFSPNSNLLYASTQTKLYQFDLSAANILSSQKLIGIWDGYYSPHPPFACDFVWHMLAPDGKIYINSGSAVVDLHVINYPDSLDTLCNFRQHSFHLPGYNSNTLPNDINYWLGAVTGSPCDTILKVKEEITNNFNLTIFPNPISDNTLHILYRLPQGKEGKLEVIDINGKIIFTGKLPMWSTQQSLSLPNLSSGIYALSITNSNQRQIKKFIKN